MLATVQGCVDSVQYPRHLFGAFGNGHIDDGVPLPLDFLPKTTSFVLRDLVVRFQRLLSLCQVDEVIDAGFEQVTRSFTAAS